MAQLLGESRGMEAPNLSRAIRADGPLAPPCSLVLRLTDPSGPVALAFGRRWAPDQPEVLT